MADAALSRAEKNAQLLPHDRLHLSRAPLASVAHYQVGAREVNPGEHSIIFGITGCGKSTLMAKIVDLYPRRVIFDRLYQWPDQGGRVVSSFQEFQRTYQELYTLPEFTIYVRPRRGIPEADLIALTDQILCLIYQAEYVNKLGLAVVFEEIWLYAPTYSIPHWFQELILTGRNAKISIIGNAQRPASVSKFITSQCRHIFVGQFFDYRDRKYFEDTFGRLEIFTRPPQKFQFIWFKPGEEPVLVST